MVTPTTLALASALITALLNVSYRRWMKRRGDAWAIVLFNSLFGGLFLALVTSPPNFALLDTTSIALLAAANSLWAIMVYYDLKAYEALDIGSNAILDTTRFVGVFLLGALLFGESLSPLRLVGMALIAASALSSVTLSEIRSNSSMRFRIISVAAGAAAMLFDKYLTTTIDINLVLLSGYFIPGALYLLIRPHAVKAIVPEIRASRGGIIISALAYAVMGLCIIYAIGEGAISNFTALHQTKIVFSVLLAALIMGEWREFRSHLVASSICVLGALCVTLG